MNLRKIYNLLAQEFPNFGFGLAEESKERVYARADVTFEEYVDDVVTVEVFIFKDCLSVFFTFDKIEKSFDTYDLVNKFNAEVPYFKAFISEDNFLAISGRVENIPNEKEYIVMFNCLLDLLFSDQQMRFLKPLCELTK